MRSRRRRAVRSAAPVITLLLALLVLFALAEAAAAAPPEPTMDLEQLATALESGPLDGYMLTTMKGTTPEEIPLQVQSLVDYSWGSLILFEASGPWIDKIGGIAAGMSGSPVYVDDGGVDKLVGALSYGDAFTLGGLGLATPIEYMAAIETDYAVGALAALQAPRPPTPGAYPLAEPVRTSAGVVRSVVVARSATAAASVGAASGQAVMTPLGILEIGGAKPGSKAFERVAARFEKTGLLVKAASGDGRWAGAPTPDLTGGSPLRDTLLAGRRVGRRRRHRHLRRRRLGDALRAPLPAARRHRRHPHGRRRAGRVGERLHPLQADRPSRRQGRLRPGPQLGRPGAPRAGPGSVPVSRPR